MKYEQKIGAKSGDSGVGLCMLPDLGILVGHDVKSTILEHARRCERQ